MTLYYNAADGLKEDPPKLVEFARKLKDITNEVMDAIHTKIDKEVEAKTSKERYF